MIRLRVAELGGKSSPALVEFNQWLTSKPELNVSVSLRADFLEKDDLYLEWIHVPTTGKQKGVAREVMAKLISIAQRRNIPLSLEASEEGESSSWLQDWYSRLGFDYSDRGMGDYGPYMVKWPK